MHDNGSVTDQNTIQDYVVMKEDFANVDISKKIEDNPRHLIVYGVVQISANFELSRTSECAAEICVRPVRLSPNLCSHYWT